MSIDVDGLIDKANYENRIASGYVDGTRMSVQARVASKRDSKPRGTPYIRVSVGGNEEFAAFSNVRDLDRRFEELVEEYGLSE